MSDTELDAVEAIEVDEDFEMQLALAMSLSAAELNNSHSGFFDFLVVL